MSMSDELPTGDESSEAKAPQAPEPTSPDPTSTEPPSTEPTREGSTEAATEHNRVRGLLGNPVR